MSKKEIKKVGKPVKQQTLNDNVILQNPEKPMNDS